MLLRINEELVIKSDRYCFMLCQDKGKQKFPGGVVADYFKPMTYHSNISNIRIDDEKFKELAQAEIELLNLIGSLKIDKERQEANFMGFTATKDRDCFVIKIGSGYSLYYGNLNQALASCWTHHLRIADEFGHDSVFCTYESISNCIKGIKAQLECNIQPW